MKTVLCYGDSNTWGYNPVSGERHHYKDRWTTILQKKLGSEFHIIPEGLNGRTTVWDDPIEGYKNGSSYLIPCLESHNPIDLVIIMLGTNDLKVRFSLPACDIAAGVGVLADMVLKSNSGPGGNPPEVLILIPPEIRNLTGFKEMFEGSRETSLKFPRVFRVMAEDRTLSYLDIGKTVRFSDADGIHFESEQLPILGNLIAEKVRILLND